MKRCWIVMETRLKANPEILRQRREIVEHPFGSIKQWMNQGAFLMRGLEKVRAEFSLTALAYNLRRALKHSRRRQAVGAGGGCPRHPEANGDARGRSLGTRMTLFNRDSPTTL